MQTFIHLDNNILVVPVPPTYFNHSVPVTQISNDFMENEFYFSTENTITSIKIIFQKLILNTYLLLFIINKSFQITDSF